MIGAVISVMLSVSKIRGPGNRCRDVYRMPKPAECVWVGPQRVPIPETDCEWGMLGKVKRLAEELAPQKKSKQRRAKFRKERKSRKKWTTISNAARANNGLQRRAVLVLELKRPRCSGRKKTA